MQFNIVSVLPIITVSFGACAFLAGYGIALGNDHVDPWIPYISDCGTAWPESMVFGQLLNAFAFSLALLIYLLYCQHVSEFEEHFNTRKGHKYFTKFVMIWGIVSTAGASIVANFSEGNQLTVHSIGAFTFFIGITIYFAFIIAIALMIRRQTSVLTYCRIVLVIAIAITLIFHATCVFAQPFVTRVNGKLPPTPNWPLSIERPKPGTTFYTNHVAAALSEWILAILQLIFISTFIAEFSTNNFERPRFVKVLEMYNTSDTGSSHRKHEQDAYRLPYYDSFSPNISPPTFSNRRLQRFDQIHTASDTGYSAGLTGSGRHF